MERVKNLEQHGRTLRCMGIGMWRPRCLEPRRPSPHGETRRKERTYKPCKVKWQAVSTQIGGCLMTDKEQRRQLWAARIADFRASGLTMSAWCTANQCSIDQLKYWLYKAKDKLPSPSTNASRRWVPLEAIDSQPVAPRLVFSGCLDRTSSYRASSGFQPAAAS